MGSAPWFDFDRARDPWPDQEWTADIPTEAQDGPAIVYDDEDGEALGVVWWTYQGGGLSKITHWQPLPFSLSPPDRAALASATTTEPDRTGEAGR